MSPDCIQCVLVIYRTTLEDSKSFQTLSAALREHRQLASRVSLLIYDNSPMSQSLHLPVDWCAQVRYHHNPANGGLAVAYNQALRNAEESGCTWLWLFDQDTTVVPELIPATFAAIDRDVLPEVSAIVPRLVQNDIMLSPVAVQPLRYRRLHPQVTGIQSEWLTALNSAACLRVSALRAIGGFPPQYWLDFLDYAVFHRLHTRGGKLLVLDLSVPHRLSINNLREESSHDRFHNVLDAEWKYIRETGWGGGSLVHRFRLMKRAVKTLITLREPVFALQVLKASLR